MKRAGARDTEKRAEVPLLFAYKANYYSWADIFLMKCSYDLS